MDTNVLVSALLSPLGPPARILDLMVTGQLTLLFDDRILYEYREVLQRPRFAFDTLTIDQLLAFFDRQGERITAFPLQRKIPDPDDLPFLEVALTGKADALITGNKPDYGTPPKGLKVLNPAEFLRIID